MFWKIIKIKLKDLICDKNTKWSEKQLQMQKSISNCFDDKISKIIISKDNKVIDGNHRYKILLNKFGGEYEINVFKLNIESKTYYFFSLLLFPLTLIIGYLLLVMIPKIKLNRMHLSKSAGLFLINKENKILICHPTKHKNNIWTIPKGKLEYLECAIDACFRETYEETNIDVSEYHEFVIKLDEVKYKHNKKILIPFVLFEEDCENLKLNSIELKCVSKISEKIDNVPEIDSYKWVTLKEAKNLLHEAQIKCLYKLEEMLNERKNNSNNEKK